MANTVKFGDTVTFDLDAYEQLVAEMKPGAADRPAEVGTAPRITMSSAPIVRTADGIKVATTVEIPAGYREARLTVLLEPDQEIKVVKADAVDTGKALALSTENGGHGIWHWFYTELTPGKHSIELTIHSTAPAHLSAWLLARRDLGPNPNTILPAQNIERATHLLLEETIR